MSISSLRVSGEKCRGGLDQKELAGIEMIWERGWHYPLKAQVVRGAQL